MGDGASGVGPVVERIVGDQEEMTAADAAAILEGSNYYGQHGKDTQPLPEGVTVGQVGPDYPSEAYLEAVAQLQAEGLIKNNDSSPTSPTSNGGYEVGPEVSAEEATGDTLP